MASLWTGTFPTNHGIIRYNHVLPEEALLPAEIFRGAGYRTDGIWRNGWVAPNFGFGQGFEFYVNPQPGRERERIQSRHPSGATLKAFYHSHPNHDAYFSAEDKAGATPFGEPTYPEAAQIVVSIYDRIVKRVRAYVWNPERQDFVEVPVTTPSL